ncbi:hypothetical protein B0F90DRAFT_1116027 [Multifurca ochricompacta]|uniref:Actin cytoskeleton-regulatory complex protein SLA1 n=1 Tax=Multifurca ochricompacta TaxID=376703 RepID=A0AAD4M006_9AGAM|nr:hypothetical protein B0F90DRAFT_1116027 [Multifurca ochricompacta]
MDAIKTWAISEIDKKGKKKKGTLGIGNGAIFFASEADKTPVQKWQIGDIISADIDKSKHILIEVGGAAAASLHFHSGNKDTAEEILVKFESSRSLARQSPELAAAPQAETERQAEQEFESAPAYAPTQRALPPPLRTDGTHSPSKKGVHFSEASPAIIPPRPASPPEQEAAQHEEVEGLEAVALYDFQAQGDDELTVAEGDALWIIEKDGDEWWKCRNVKGDEGVVPASYIEPTGPGRLPSRPEEPEEEDEDDGGAAEREAEERAAAERAEQKEKEELEHKERQAKEQRAKAAAVAAEAERKRKEKEKREREREERELEERVRREKEKEHEEEEDAEAEEEARRLAAERKASKAAAKAARSSKSTSEGRKSLEKRAPPDSSQTREWRDRTGQFRVEAAFLGYKNGVLRLHKINGVVIEVPSEKMSIEDIRHVEKLMGRGGSSSRKPDDDDEPLAKRRQSLQSAPVAAAPPKKAPPIDWFEFFLNAGCDVDDCTRYASSFDRDKIDESILPDITESTLRTLGLREGDIIRVTKAIDGRRPKPPAKPAPSEVSLLGGDDALASVPAPARATPSPGPPNLFTNPGGQLKNARRGRPTPNKTGSTAPGSVELGAISTASEQIARSTTPLMASPVSTSINATTLLPAQQQQQPPSRSNSVVSSGFDDDAWTNRPSSTKPVAPTPPLSVPPVPPVPVPERAASVPAVYVAPAPAPSQQQQQPPRAPSAAPAIQQPSASTSSGLARTTESDIFDQLARLSQLRVQSPTATASRSTPVPSPSITSPPPQLPGYNQGLGVNVGPSPVPLGQHLQVQAQQTGLLPPPAPGGPRGPFAPVPANQGLLAPLVPTTTGFPGFLPTRPVAASPSPSFLGPQMTGYQQQQQQQPQPTGFQPAPSLLSQPTSFQPIPLSLASQPTGFQLFHRR